MDSDLIPMLADEKPELVENIDKTLVQARQYEIVNDGQYQGAGDFLKGVKVLLKEIDAYFDPLIKRANDTVKGIRDKKKEQAEPLAQAESILKQKMGVYWQEKERIRREEERKLQEQAEKQAKAQGISVVPQVIVEQTAKVEGVSYVTIWKFRIVDESAIPREYLIPDEKKIGAVVRTMKDKTAIPGIEPYKDTTTKVRV